MIVEPLGHWVVSQVQFTSHNRQLTFHNWGPSGHRPPLQSSSGLQRQTLLIRKHRLGPQRLGEVDSTKDDLALLRRIQSYRPFVVGSIEEDFLIRDLFTADMVDGNFVQSDLESCIAPIDIQLQIRYAMEYQRRRRNAELRETFL